MTPAHCRLRIPSVIINLCQVGKKSGSARAKKEGNGHSSASNRTGPCRLLPLLFYGAVGQATGDATTLGVGFKTAANHIGLNSCVKPPGRGADNQPQNSGRTGNQQPTRYQHRNKLRRMRCRKSGKAPQRRRPPPPDWAAAQAPFTHHILRAGRQSAALPTRRHFIGGYCEPQPPPRPPPALSELGSPVNLAAGDCAGRPHLMPTASPRHNPPTPDAGIAVPAPDCRRLRTGVRICPLLPCLTQL